MRRFLILLATIYKRVAVFFLKVRGLSHEGYAEKRIVTGESWADFCDTLKAAGANVLGQSGMIDTRTQAEGYRYLSRLTRAGLEAFVEYADPRAPVLRRMVHETVKMGADNPDNYYENACVSGELEYRVWGTRGTVHFLTLSTQKGGYGEGGDLPPTGFLDSKALLVNPDGTFEVRLSQKKQAGNWLKMAPETGMLIVRQTFLDKTKEIPASLTIECLSGDGLPTPLTPVEIDTGLKTASNLVAGASFLFAKWVKEFKKHKNTLPLFDPQKSTKAGGDPQIAYYHSYFELAADEALVVQVMPPECEHWNFQLNNYWMESLDYRYFDIHVNKSSAVYNDDGSVTIVVAHENPGVPNWLTTTGHKVGTMCFRWIRAKAHPTPVVHLVKPSQGFDKFKRMK